MQFHVRYAEEGTPPLVFLHQAWRKIGQALQRFGRPPPPEPAPGGELVLAPGDQPFDLSKPPTFPLAFNHWTDLQDKFSLSWTETFHILHRLTARAWLNVVYKNWAARAPLEHGIGCAKASIAIMTMALGALSNNRKWRPGKRESRFLWLFTRETGDQFFLATLRLTDAEPGPPTLESVQARLLQVLYLLSTCRLSQAWYVFGNVVHMLTALGLHRRRGRNRGLGPEIVVQPEYAKVQCERRTFWAVYILDKQLALMSGRPCYFNIDNIDQEFPDCVNDEDMGRFGPYRPHRGDCYVEALVEQAK